MLDEPAQQRDDGVEVLLSVDVLSNGLAARKPTRRFRVPLALAVVAIVALFGSMVRSPAPEAPMESRVASGGHHAPRPSRTVSPSSPSVHRHSRPRRVRR